MSDELEAARAEIERLERDVDRLRRRLDDERFAEDLRDAVTLAAAAGTIGSPVKHARLIEMIVETAAAVIGARAGSLFLIDFAADELVFEVAIGPEAEQIEGFRMPMTQGIAGLVATSGQPMAVSEARENPQVFREIGERVKHHPESILCVPLFYGDRVIGVFEMIDKIGAAGFTGEDMRVLGMFANQAAIAIELSRTYRHVMPLMVEMLAALGETDSGRRIALAERGTAFAMDLEDEVSYQEAIDLAKLVQEIAWRGDEERVAVLTILRGFADYLRTRAEMLEDLG
jgi:GAF domain-containing protein